MVDRLASQSFVLDQMLTGFRSDNQGGTVHESTKRLLWIAIPLCLVSVVLAGCDLPKRPPLGRRSTESPQVERRIPDEDSPPLGEAMSTPENLFKGGWETWDAYFVGSKQVGYAHLIAEPHSTRSGSDMDYRVHSRFYVEQGNSRILQDLRQASTETSDGELLRFKGVMRFGPVVTRAEGNVEDGRLQVKTLRGSSQTIRSIPWESKNRGLAALEQSLRDRPMREKGESRTLKMLLPGQYVLATARLRCQGLASVPQIDGTQVALQEIECEIELGEGRTIFSTIWTDGQGEIVRTYSPEMQMVAYRTDEATATQILNDDSIPVAIATHRSIEDPSTVPKISFRISPLTGARSANALLALTSAPGQFVRPMENGGLELRVRGKIAAMDLEGFTTAELVSVQGDLEPNVFVDSDSPFIKRMSEAMSFRDLTESERVVELARAASELVQHASAQGSLAKASEVAQQSRGDSSERAVLLAALLRAKGIPSRLAIGLKTLTDEPNRMVYHVWTMAHVDGQWLHVDATEGGIASPNRIQFSSTNLSGGNEYAAMLPLLRTIRRIEIEVVDLPQ